MVHAAVRDLRVSVPSEGWKCMDYHIHQSLPWEGALLLFLPGHLLIAEFGCDAGPASADPSQRSSRVPSFA